MNWAFGPFLILKCMKTETVKKLLEPVVCDLGYELWGLEYLPQGKHSILRIFIDKPTGIQIEDCEIVSHQVSAILDVEAVIPGNYNLEVSSPGLERPLFEEAHYQRYLGQEVKLKLQKPIQDKRQYIGVMEELEKRVLKLRVDGELVSMPLDVITKANLVS